MQVDRRRLRVLPQQPVPPRQYVRVGLVQDEAFPRQADGRPHHRRTRHRAVFHQRGVEAKHRARNANRLPAIQAGAAHRLTSRIEIHVTRRRRRRRFAKIDEDVPAIGQMRGQEPAAAYVAATRVHHRLGIADSDGGIDGVAALPQDVHPRLGRQTLGRHDKARAGREGGKRGRVGARDQQQEHQQPASPNASSPLGFAPHHHAQPARERWLRHYDPFTVRHVGAGQVRADRMPKLAPPSKATPKENSPSLSRFRERRVGWPPDRPRWRLSAPAVPDSVCLQ